MVHNVPHGPNNCVTDNVEGWFSAVQQVDAVDVVLAHPCGRAEDGVGVGNSHQGGADLVLGEIQSAGGNNQFFFYI